MYTSSHFAHCTLRHHTVHFDITLYSQSGGHFPRTPPSAHKQEQRSSRSVCCFRLIDRGRQKEGIEEEIWREYSVELYRRGKTENRDESPIWHTIPNTFRRQSRAYPSGMLRARESAWNGDSSWCKRYRQATVIWKYCSRAQHYTPKNSTLNTEARTAGTVEETPQLSSGNLDSHLYCLI